MSVVAPLSEWLVHTNRRHDGAWSQRYERSTPVTGLVPVADGGQTGTTVHFLPDPALLGLVVVSAGDLRSCVWPPPLTVETKVYAAD
jgi:topoisomerase IV subunit B